MASSSSNSPCAACKFLRRKCQPECVFAPYFPPDQPQKFANVHKVFGASNVTKLLNELHPHQREDAVNSLAYEADMRLRDPVYGCVGVISLLQHQLCKLQMDLTCAKSELSKYQNLGIGSHAALISPPSAVAAASHGQRNHQPAFNFARDQPHSLYHDQFFPRDQQPQQMMLRRSFDGGSNYDAGLLAVNVTASLGNLSHQFQQPRAAAGDDRRGEEEDGSCAFRPTRATFELPRRMSCFWMETNELLQAAIRRKAEDIDDKRRRTDELCDSEGAQKGFEWVM